MRPLTTIDDKYLSKARKICKSSEYNELHLENLDDVTTSADATSIGSGIFCELDAGPSRGGGSRGNYPGARANRGPGQGSCCN